MMYQSSFRRVISQRVVQMISAALCSLLLLIVFCWSVAFATPADVLVGIETAPTATAAVMVLPRLTNSMTNSQTVTATTTTATVTQTSALTASVASVPMTNTLGSRAVAGAEITATTQLTDPLAKTTNILVLGSDRRSRTPDWRTDVLMIVALDFEAGRAGVISVPRDVYIDYIPNHQPNRVNVIDYLGERDDPGGGGPALLSRIIAERMKIRIDHYLRFDFESFKTVVDALGGVTVNIDCRYVDYWTGGGLLGTLEPGLVHFSGEEALVYVRSRLNGGDLDRVRRQQRFVWAVRNQMLSKKMLPRVPKLYQTLKESIETDIGIVSAIHIVRFTLALNEEDIHGVVLAPPKLLTPSWRAGMSVFLPDWPQISLAVQDIFESPAFVETNTPQSCP